MLWTIAYSANYTAAQTDTDMPLLTDQTVTVDSNNHPLLPLDLWGAWVYAVGNTMSRVRISAPKFRPIVRPLIRPLEQANNPSSRPIMMEWFRHPIQFRKVEPIAMLVSNNAPTGGERNFVVLTLTDNQYNSPAGDMYTLRFTTAFTPTANAWSASGNITFDDTLQAGRYSVIGFEQFAAGGIASRLIFPGAPIGGHIPQIRPGILVPTANGSEHNRYFRYGRLGEYGQFESFAPPQIEVLFTAGTANPEGYFDVVNVRVGYGM